MREFTERSRLFCPVYAGGHTRTEPSTLDTAGTLARTVKFPPRTIRDSRQIAKDSAGGADCGRWEEPDRTPEQKGAQPTNVTNGLRTARARWQICEHFCILNAAANIDQSVRFVHRKAGKRGLLEGRGGH